MKERYQITIEVQPDNVPPAIRLRHLLKFALRLNLRCINITTIVDDLSGQTPDADDALEGLADEVRGQGERDGMQQIGPVDSPAVK